QVQKARDEIPAAKSAGLRAGKDAEKRRSERLVKGLAKKLTIANERIRQLQRGTTPQTEGLEFEDRLRARLKHEFPEDDIVLEGKGGDVLHTVMLKGKPVGLILYECKRTKTIDRAHVEQAMRDKRSRQADFAILVTTGTRRGFTGFGREGPVLLVAPQGVITLAGLVRAQIIEMARAKLSRSEKERIAGMALDYLTSPTFRAPLEEAISRTRRAQALLRKEYEQHATMWRERWQLYQTVDLDLSHISANASRLLDGKKPLPIEKAKPAPLQLPAVTGGS
ncbi:MAG: DUF2130 domain-containing protein, partial [Thermoanaerobaculia bacterium]